MVDILDTFRARMEGGATSQMVKLFDLRKFKARRSIADAISGIMMQLKEVSELRDRYTINSILGNRVATSVIDPAITASLYKTVTRLVGSNMAMTELLGDEYSTTLNLIGCHERVHIPGRVAVEWRPEDMEDKLRFSNWFVADENKKLGVLSIVGFSGSGKTHMATALYREYGNLFERRAVVTISLQSDPEIILRNILSQLRTMGNNGDKQCKFKGSNGSIFNRIRLPSLNRKEDVGAGKDKFEQIIMELRTNLETTRYLLLIDDVWSSSTWKAIKRYFPDNERGSRIIVTTRLQAVAVTCSIDHDTDIVHPVQLLSGSEAKMLFQKTFSECSGTTQDIEQSLSEIPDRVWEMCGGIPMAIVTMAGLAASKKQMTREDWIQVCNSLFPESQSFHGIGGVSRLINHCYNDFDNDLKSCFLYLSVFPKDHEISRKRLIRRWMAEGFVISEKPGLSVEEVAEMCFNQLINRNILWPVQYSNRGRMKTCQVHGKIHEYISSKAANEELITVVGSQWSLPRRSSNKVRRLSIHSTEPTSATKVDSMNLSHVRSLTVFGSLKNLHLRSLKSSLVQILDLQGCTGFLENYFKVSHICEMVLLKYLSLRRTDIKDIPGSICNLRYLETLDIRETEVEELPAAVGQLEQIRNILCGNKVTRRAVKFPKKIKKGGMNKLGILSGIEITEGSTAASNFHYFTWLKKLVIYKVGTDTSVMKDLLSSIQYLGGYSLTTLVIDDESSDLLCSLDSMSAPPKYLSALELSGRLHKLPKWIPDLYELTKLTLSGTVLGTDTLVLLGELHSLFSLTFSINEAKQSPDMEDILEKNKSESGGEIFFPNGGFNRLKLLRIFVPLLPSLNFSSNGTPQLERIELRFRRLEGLLGMDRLQMLRNVVLTVDGEQSELTESILEDLKRESSKSQYQLIVY